MMVTIPHLPTSHTPSPGLAFEASPTVNYAQSLGSAFTGTASILAFVRFLVNESVLSAPPCQAPEGTEQDRNGLGSEVRGEASDHTSNHTERETTQTMQEAQGLWTPCLEQSSVWKEQWLK